MVLDLDLSLLRLPSKPNFQQALSGLLQQKCLLAPLLQLCLDLIRFCKMICFREGLLRNSKKSSQQASLTCF